MTIHVVAELVARSGREDELRALFAPFAEASAREPGCLEYTLMEDEARPGRFLTHERWESEDAMKAHLATDAIRALGAKLPDLLAQPLSITNCRRVA